MPSTDLDYFRERNLDRTNIKDFYDSLPSHLQSRFRECNHAKIVWENVLQGYRGPSNLRNGDSDNGAELKPSHGIQEIKFWWGIRKDLNYLPVLGSYLFGVNRVVQSFNGDLEWSSLYFDSKTGECLSHDINEAFEKLNDRGSQLFIEGKYAEAVEYHKNAYQSCSTGYRSEQIFKNCGDKAKSELDAMHLNSQGDNLFMQGKYLEAYSKYQDAYNKSQVETLRSKYSTNRDRAQSEIYAINLNSQGDDLFMKGKYNEAYSNYHEAYNKSQVYTQHNTYYTNSDMAQSEIHAINLNSQGDNLFKGGKYSEAQRKYQDAYNKSQVDTQRIKYSTNSDMAQSEIHAINLNSQGDNLFMQGKYSEARSKYQEAYNISQTTKEKNVYAINKGKAQTLINKLSILHKLWNKAWDAENDTEKNRSDEAQETFKRVLSETENCLKIFPDNWRFKEYKLLASLKIEGNDLFNLGLKSQKDGTKCLEKSHELKLQQKFKLAHIKYQRAKDKYYDAQRKFRIVSEIDQRFLSCIEFVQEQLNVVIESIEITESHTLNHRFNDLNINISNDNLETNAYESNIEGQLG